MKVNYEKIDIHNLPQVYSLWTDYHIENAKKNGYFIQTPETLKNGLGWLNSVMRSPGFMGVAVRKGKKILGFMTAFTVGRQVFPTYILNIEACYVDPKYRKNGIFKGMFEHIKYDLKIMGVTNFEIMTHHKDQEKIIEKLGFTQAAKLYQKGV